MPSLDLELLEEELEVERGLMYDGSFSRFREANG